MYKTSIKTQIDWQLDRQIERGLEGENKGRIISTEIHGDIKIN